MIESDPFEAFKRKRQIAKLEKKFTSDPAAPVDASDSNAGSDVASQVDSEMQQFFSESQQNVSDVVDETADDSEPNPFSVSPEEAEELLSALDDTADDGPAIEIVDQLRDIFQQGVDEIAAAQREIELVDSPSNAAPVPLEASELAEPAPDVPPVEKPKSAIIPVVPLPPMADVKRQGLEPERPVTDGEDGQKLILKRQGHIPATNRRSAFSAVDRAELRAMKALLLAKGIITQQELSDEMARDLNP